MLTVLPYDISSLQPLTQTEKNSVIAIEEVVRGVFKDIGIDVESRHLQIVKDTMHGCPQFCSKLQNPYLPCDLIIVDMESLDRWNQFVFQFSHEYTHYIIHCANDSQEQRSSWVEETICEAVSLFFLQYFWANWTQCELYNWDPGYCKYFKSYLESRLNTPGNHRLGQCYDVEELKAINQTSQDCREDRAEEMHSLYKMIRLVEDIEGLVHYKDFVVPETILLDTSKYRDAYPNSLAIQYLCSLQEKILKRD